MNISALKDTIIKYIEDNKIKYNIEYSYTLTTIDMLVNEIYKEYIEIMEKKEEVK